MPFLIIFEKDIFVMDFLWVLSLVIPIIEAPFESECPSYCYIYIYMRILFEWKTMSQTQSLVVTLAIVSNLYLPRQLVLFSLQVNRVLFCSLLHLQVLSHAFVFNESVCVIFYGIRAQK